MAEVLQAIDLHLVYADLTQPETLKDALYSIKRLSDAVDLIFDKIDRKVSVERQRLASINQRLPPREYHNFKYNLFYSYIV